MPSLNYGETDGFQELIESLIANIFKQASLISRVAMQTESNHYQVRHDKL
jgi:hypothetical protein